jgi:L-amino acid N-acyltransferase YncA
MELTVRDARPDDAAAILRIFNPIINPDALATYCSHGFRVVGVAENQAKINGRYIDEVIVERFL